MFVFFLLGIRLSKSRGPLLCNRGLASFFIGVTSSGTMQQQLTATKHNSLKLIATYYWQNETTFMLRYKHVCDPTLRRRQTKTTKDFKKTTTETKGPFGGGKQMRLAQSKKTFKSVCAEIQCSRRSWPSLQEIA